MNGILGKKIGMTNIFDEKGRNVPVTLVEAGPCHVVQVKTRQKDGYDAIQLAFGFKRQNLINKPDAQRFKKAGIEPARYIREIKVTDKEIANFKAGQKLDADVFAKGDWVDITGISIGRGFQGGVKRWGWAGGDAGHGSMFHRRIGSIQSGARLNRVTKGHHMPGHMGCATITVQNIEVLDVDKANNLLIVKGSVPGHKNCLLIVKESKKRPKGYVRKIVQTVSKKSAKAQAKKK